jgi:hypothetical protein
LPSSAISMLISFLVGVVLCASVTINMKFASSGVPAAAAAAAASAGSLGLKSSSPIRSQALSILDGTRILIDIAAFDFSQLPHMEEVLDAYLDLCAAGAKVDVYIHATVAYPVTLIDLLNSRLHCNNPSPRAGFTVTVVLVSSNVRLHLVDFHRPLFYEHIDEYDLFVYTEDDIRVSPRTVAAYMAETERVRATVGPDEASDYNVGVTRYEYSFPTNLVIDDKTRHATQNVTRVYWEHSWHPPIPKSMDAVSQEPFKRTHVHMKNHHQGMFLATRDLLKAWKDRPGCEFDKVKNRPGLKKQPSQPAEGTQRVWMSSQQLYGEKHCRVQQLLPMDQFGALTVLHLPNKNYRRVGKKGRIGGHDSKVENKFRDGTESFEVVSPLLLTAMQLHIDMRRTWPATPQDPYIGIRMVDQVQQQSRSPLLERRMAEYTAYVARGGVMSTEDMNKTSLIE